MAESSLFLCVKFLLVHGHSYYMVLSEFSLTVDLKSDRLPPEVSLELFTTFPNQIS